MVLTVKKLVAEMTENEIVKLSSITDFNKDKLNILSKSKLKYKADLTLNKGMDVRTGGTCPHFFTNLYIK